MISPTTGRKPTSRFSSGFTLVELLLVCVLIGTLVAVILPRLSSSARSVNDEECIEILKRMILYAREEAVRTRLSYRLEVDTKNERFRITRKDPTDMSSNRYVTLEDSIFTDWTPFPPGTKIEQEGGTAEKTNGTQWFTFSPSGVGEAGTLLVTFTNGHARTIKIGDWYDQVTVQKSTVTTTSSLLGE